MRNKFAINFETHPADERQEVLDDIAQLCAQEKDLVISARPFEVAQHLVTVGEDDVLWTWVFYENGLGLNVLYTLTEGGKRAVGLKLSDGMDVPAELVDRFKFARQRSKLAGTIRGSYFVIKQNHSDMIERWLSALK